MDSRTDSGALVDGRYQIGRLIGSGGMGAVYAATQVDTQTTVAIKLLHARYGSASKIAKRFYQEASLTSALDHPNICSAIDHGCTEDGTPYLVMPLLKGVALSELLERRKRLSVPRVIRIASQVLSALESAHQSKIVHRDLKPDNIFILSNSDTEDHVKLLDFGISKVLEKGSSSTLTSTGMVLGTAYYLAPEQAKGARRIDHRVDIYAMGVILYQALLGRLPFEGETYNEVVYKILNDPYKAPRYLNPSVPGSLERVIMTAMAIDPLKRYASAREMLDALNLALERPELGEGDTVDLLGKTEKTAYVTTGAAPAVVRRRPWRAVAAAGLAAASMAGILWWSAVPREERPDVILKDQIVASTPVTAVPSGPIPSKKPETPPLDEPETEEEETAKRESAAVEPAKPSRRIETGTVRRPSKKKPPAVVPPVSSPPKAPEPQCERQDKDGICFAVSAVESTAEKAAPSASALSSHPLSKTTDVTAP